MVGCACGGDSSSYETEVNLIVYRCVVGNDCDTKMFDRDPTSPPICCGQAMAKV